MNDIAEMKQRASTLRKGGNYGEAVELFRLLWEEHREECDEWDGWGYAQSLRKLGHSREALEVCREVYPIKPDFDYLRNLYAWCIFDLELKREDTEIAKNERQFFKAANAILDLVEPGQYSPAARTVMEVVDYLRSKTTPPAAEIFEWLDRLEVDQLSAVASRGPDGKGKTVGYASDREKWYAARCRTLFELGRYQECINWSERALSEFQTFHHDNDIWFKWRIALSQAELGYKESAIAEIEELLSRKKDWFFYHKIAEYLFDLGRPDEALERAVEAVLAPGQSDLGFKWKLILLMGRIYETQSEPDKARQHVLLAFKVHQEQEWKIPPELSQAVSELGVDVNAQETAKELYQELRRHWKSHRVSNLKAGKGAITSMLGHGKAGFIRDDAGKDYYFKVSSFQGSRNLLKPGQRVVFHIEPNPEPGKRDIAVFIKPEQGS